MPTSQSLPVYLQISELLIREIQSGRLPDGTRLAPERTMAQDYGISVGTLRKSLANLEEKGMLQRVQGSGNYVKHQADPKSVYALFRLELVGGGGLPTAKVLSVSNETKPKDMPAFGSGDRAFRIRRLRSLSGRTAALEEIWLDAGRAPDLSESDLSESLYLYYQTKLGIWIERAEDRIGVGFVPNWGAEVFPMANRPVGQIDRVSWDQNGQTVEISRTWYDSEHITYVSRLK